MAGRGVISFGIGASEYPEVLLHRLGGTAPDSVHALGDPGVLRRSLTALLCSERIAPDLVLPALDQMMILREAGDVLVSGFHSAVERECLQILLKGDRPAIACLARDLHTLRMPGDWRRPVEDGRLLLLSACGSDVRRPTARTADERNRLVAALASRVFIVGATPGGRLHRLAREIAARGQEMICFDHPANEDLILLGARLVPLRSYRTQPAADARASAAST